MVDRSGASVTESEANLVECLRRAEISQREAEEKLERSEYLRVQAEDRCAEAIATRELAKSELASKLEPVTDAACNLLYELEELVYLIESRGGRASPLTHSIIKDARGKLAPRISCTWRSPDGRRCYYPEGWNGHVHADAKTLPGEPL